MQGHRGSSLPFRTKTPEGPVFRAPLVVGFRKVNGQLTKLLRPHDSVAAERGQLGLPWVLRRSNYMQHLARALAAVTLVGLIGPSPSAAQNLRTVAVLSTGGTIASRQDPGKGGYVPALSADDLIASVPAINSVARIETQQVSNISSSDMTPQVWVQLLARINELLLRTEIAGAVVTHGTNTLEETAYFLDLTVASSKPVVLVGAQRPASDPDADGPRNLLDAIRVVSSPEAIGKGVMVVMNGQINAARDVTKTNTSQVETFRSLEFGALGVVDVEAVRFYRSPLRRQTLTPDPGAALRRVEIVTAYAGADGRSIRSLMREGDVDGIVVTGLGLGGVPGLMFDAIQEARKKGVPVVVGTRVPTGRVFPLSATKASALSLKAIGCVLADNLSPQKARVLLMLGLAKTREPELLQKYFDQ
jgi:L-asparaginase